MDSDIVDNELLRLQKINNRLLRILMNLADELISYATEHSIKPPSEIIPLLDEAEKLIDEQTENRANTKYCHICKELNPENAKFCNNCGTTLDIISAYSRIGHDNKNSRKGDTTNHI